MFGLGLHVGSIGPSQVIRKDPLDLASGQPEPHQNRLRKCFRMQLTVPGGAARDRPKLEHSCRTCKTRRKMALELVCWSAGLIFAATDTARRAPSI